MKVSDKQRQEWTRNPVTLALKELCEKEFKEIQFIVVSDCIVRGEPQLTQENLVELSCRELEWGGFIQFLEGDWSEMELDDEK